MIRPTYKLTVNLTEKAHQALNRASEASGYNKTDTVCQALGLYAEIVVALLDDEPNIITVTRHDGSSYQIFVIDPTKAAKNGEGT